MRIEPVEIFSDASNVAVMRHPGRRFPGSLIQGDSLFALVVESRALYSAVAAGDDDGLTCLALDHKEKLESRLAEYERSLLAHGIALPYAKQRSAGIGGVGAGAEYEHE